MMLSHLSLFSGIGGIDLASEWAGFTVVGQVEKDVYATRILRRRFGNVPRWSDIKTFTAEKFRRRTGIEYPTLVSGGFPCQPFSCAGKRRGKEDDRYLWPEMFRVVQELRPTWVIGENVDGIINMELDNAIIDLESENYSCRAFSIPAVAIGATHKRQRIFIVAHSNSSRKSSSWNNSGMGRINKSIPKIGPNTNSKRCKQCKSPECSTGKKFYTRISDPEWIFREIEPTIRGSTDGIPHRLDRLRCLGNAVVPQQVYPILAAIAQIETEEIIWV